VHAKGSVSAPTGTVTVLDSGRPVGSTGVTAATGGSVDVVLTLHAGVHALTARYSGDRDHQASVSTRTALAVRPVATTTTVTAQRNAKNVKQFRLAVRVRTHVASLFAPGVLTVDVGGRRYSFRLDAQGHVAFHLVLSRGVTYVVVATYPGAPDFGASSARTAFTV
jgi:hypothetical protein